MQLNLDMNGKKILNFNSNVNYMYSQVFDHFYDVRGTRNYELKVDVSGFVIDKIKPELYLENNPQIRDYDPKSGLKFAAKNYILTDFVTQNSNWTIFVSFKHDETKTCCSVSWSNTMGVHRQFYPIFRITGDKISIEDSSNMDEKQFTSDLKNKQPFLWMMKKGTTCHMTVCNYSGFISKTLNLPNTQLQQ